MDLAADMLLAQWVERANEIDAFDISPRFQNLVDRLPIVRRTTLAKNADRIWNRFRALPRHLDKIEDQFHAFHIVDHSYANLVDILPRERTGVYCHDLDTFRCLLHPQDEPRPWWFRRMARQIMTGLSHAAIVFHNTRTTAKELLKHGLTRPDRLRYAPLGVAPEFLAVDISANSESAWREIGDKPYLLHVGACIPRKRIDVLLNVASQLRRSFPDLLLVKVGEPWTSEQERRIVELGVGSSIRHLGKLSREALAGVYRHAAAVLVTSEMEGFGLPVIEALACGSAVVASELDSLHEAGGNVANFAPIGNINAWTEILHRVLTQPSTPEERHRRREWSTQFSWQNHARIIADSYHELLRDAAA